jgi:peptidoglycan/LPS O-acetylase OafA/YrhL
MKRTEIPALTGLRGLAAMLIVIHHFGLISLPLRHTFAGPALDKCGSLGMSIFFVLSGFVIHYNYAQSVAAGGRGIADFFVARFARLYPLYILFVLANFAFNLSISRHYADTLPYYVFAVQSWVYGIRNGQLIGSSQIYANNSWSISSEIALYLMFVPLALFGRFGTASARRGITLLLFAMIGRFVFTRLSVLYGGDFLQTHFGADPMLPATLWLVYISPYGRCFEFLAGVALSEIWMSKTIDARIDRLIMALGLAAGVYIGASFLHGTLLFMPALFSPDNVQIGYSLAVPFATLAICLHGKLLCGKLALWIGEISYSLYLIHSDAIFLFPKIHSTIGYIGKSIAFVLILFAGSALTYRFVEMPAKRVIMKLYRRYRAPPAPPYYT